MESDVTLPTANNSSFYNESKSNKQTEPFGKMPAWYVQLKAIKRLTRNELAVLVVLIVRQNNQNHICMPSRQTLSDYSGVCLSSISQATKNLEMSGLIKRWRKGNRVRYCILFEPPDWVKESGVYFDLKSDKLPKSSESYPRNKNTGKFISKISDFKTPSFPDVAKPIGSDAAKSLTSKVWL